MHHTDFHRSSLGLVRVLVLVVVGLGSMTASGQILGCSGDDSCRCSFLDGSGVLDISSVGKLDGTPRFLDAVSYDGATFSVNPCFKFSTTGCSDAAVCEKEAAGDSYRLLAQQSPMTWSFTGYYPILTYDGSGGKYDNSAKVEISMICDPSYDVPQLDVFGELTLGTVSMNLWSKCACADACERVNPPSSGDEDSGLTPGSIMLIIFFSVLFVYLLAGVGFNYNKTKKVGADLIPNVTFWATLPGLVKEGFLFTWGCIRGRQRAGYESPSG